MNANQLKGSLKRNIRQNSGYDLKSLSKKQALRERKHSQDNVLIDQNEFQLYQPPPQNDYLKGYKKENIMKKPSINNIKSTNLNFNNTLGKFRTGKDVVPKTKELCKNDNFQIKKIEQPIKEQKQIQNSIEQIPFNPYTSENLTISFNQNEIQLPSFRQQQNHQNNYPIFTKNLTIKHFKLTQKLGKGSYAIVHEAYDSNNNKYAIKCYETYKLKDVSIMNNVKREISILKKIDHKNIIKLYTVLEDSRQINMVMENPDNIQLMEYLKTQPNRQVDEAFAKHILYQLLEALQYCHSKNIIHRDVKLDNILLDKDYNVKLIDFGFAIISTKQLNAYCGTMQYMSPEIVQRIPHDGQKIDVWACGILLFYLLQGYFPFKGYDDNDLSRKILQNQYQFSKEISQDAKNLIQWLLTFHEADRPQVSEVLKHEWFRN